VRGEVGDGRGRGNLRGEEGVGVLRGGHGGRGGELVGLRRRGGGGHGRRIRHAAACRVSATVVRRGRGCVGGRCVGGDSLTCVSSLFAVDGSEGRAPWDHLQVQVTNEDLI
jgi:hypothetical protein